MLFVWASDERDDIVALDGMSFRAWTFVHLMRYAGGVAGGIKGFS
jgi:hypothetical protein